MGIPQVISSAAMHRQRRPWPVRLLNGPLAGLAPRSIDLEDLLTRAYRSTGLDDWGPDGMPEGLSVLVDSINSEANLHALGRLMTRERLVGVLANRLRVEAYLKQHPEVLTQTLLPLTMITGLQRTGTTKLQRMLGADPQTNCLLSWEVINPVPINPKRDPRDRIAKARFAQRALRYLNPAFFAIHPVEYHAPEEDVLILDHHFLSTVPEAILNVPGYAAWVEQQDQKPAYDYLRKVLLILQSQKNGSRWVLKSPHHLEWLEVLTEVFPQVQIIHTHRDPVETLPSFCHMIWQGRWLFSESPDPEAIGRQWNTKLRRMLERAMRFRQQDGSIRFLDVHYRDLVQDEKTVLSDIYAWLGQDLSPRLMNQLTGTSRQNGQNRYGRHLYRLEDFGLDARALRRDFADYYAFFGIPTRQLNV